MTVSSPGAYERMNVRNSHDIVAFFAILSSTGLRPLTTHHKGPFSISALRGPSFISAWASIPASRYELTRDKASVAARALFLFANTGDVAVEVGAQRIVLPRGGVVAIAPGTSTVLFETSRVRNELLLFSIETPFEMRVRSSSEPALVPRTDPSLNSYAYAACYGIALAPMPVSKTVGDALHEAATSVARILLTQSATSASTELYVAAIRYIRLHASRSELSPSMVAAHFRVSVRKLQARFHANQDTVVSAIRRSRADIARLALAQHPKLNAAVIAERAGFSSSKMMRRALLEFGSAPRANVSRTSAADGESHIFSGRGERRTTG